MKGNSSCVRYSNSSVRVAPERLVQARAATVSGASMAGTVSGAGDPCPRRSLYGSVSKPQALNEDPSDCVEACPLAGRPSLQSAFSGAVASGQEGRRSAADRRPSGRREQHITDVYDRKAAKKQSGHVWSRGPVTGKMPHCISFVGCEQA